MRYLSLFSGIEAATVAWHPLGWECVGVAEIEPFPCAVLKHHYPDVPNLGSVTDITEDDIKSLGHIDLVVFGSPCQDLSVAGHRKGLINADGTVTRSGLFFTAINIARWSGARFWLWENVPGAYSSNAGRDFAAVVEFMAGMDECPIPPKGWGTEGVAVGDNGLLEWACLDAQWFGVAQRRRRVFALADLGDWANRPPILLEPEGVRGDLAPRREAGQEVAGTIAARFGISRNNHEECVTAFTKQRLGEYSDCNVGSTCSARDYKDATDLVAHTLRGNGFDASEDGTGRGTPLVPVTFGAQMSVPQTDVDLVQTLQAKNPMAVCAPSLTASNDPSRSPQSSEVTAQVLAVMQATAFQPTAGCLTSAYGTKWNGNASATNGSLFAATAMQVRRLTPTECERLQGFPDNYTNIPWRKQPTAPDGPRYKALGNSMAVPVMAWIGKQIQNAVTKGENA